MSRRSDSRQPRQAAKPAQRRTTARRSAKRNAIEVRGARHNNLRSIDASIPLGAITAITGVSGSGKSSLAFDTLYAEGQRRYVESFSPYARQFMDRMDRPEVDSVEGVLPAVAIDQKNAIRSSRSTVGTITELTDFFKLLYAHAGQLFCDGCGQRVRSDEPPEIADELLAQYAGDKALVTFAAPACRTIKATRTALEWLAGEGYRRLLVDGVQLSVDEADARQLKGQPLQVIADRVQLSQRRRGRLVDSIESAMRRTGGRATVWIADDEGPWQPLGFSRGRHCARCDRSYPPPLPNHFSFNSPLGACRACNGFGAALALDIDLVIPDPRRALGDGAIRPWTTEKTGWERETLVSYCRQTSIPLDTPWGELDEAQRERIVAGDEARGWHGVRGWFDWLERRTYKMHVRVLLSRYRTQRRCSACGGTRLDAHALCYRVAGVGLAELYRMSIGQARRLFDELSLPAEAAATCATVLDEIRSRLRYLCEVGVEYLTLDRPSRSLSGGEVQRVNLTTAIGSGLVNTLYVLDEPSVGLHPRDNARLIAILERLRANRNTIVLVEHDEQIIRSVDHVLDLGPGPGQRGGQVVFSGSPAQLARAPKRSATARMLAGKTRTAKRPGSAAGVDLADALVVRSARQNNLRGIDVSFPRAALTVVTGVSGSGKSTLVEQVLYRGLMRQRGRSVVRPGAHRAIEGGERFDDVVLVDQTPIGTTPRSNPATYVKAFDGIRRLFSEQPRARMLGFSPATFSFNVDGGRCDGCSGTGSQRIEMQFLSDRFVTCDRCGGSRFKRSVLSVEVGGLSIADTLELTVDQALEHFADQPAIVEPLGGLQGAGLGYLRLGQPLNTLSGGESQRLKLARQLQLSSAGQALLLLDEPTTGLHLSDVTLLIENLRELVRRGNTVIVIEHHLDLISAADWLIDLGPEGGDGGGQVVACGPPAEIVARGVGHTAGFLAEHLGRDGDARHGGSSSDARRRRRVRYLAPEDIVVRGARVHNLDEIDARIPRDQLTVITGRSGSGKSSLAFDVLFAEGQRRFIDCLSPYARQYITQLGRPDIDELAGVPPTVCISQRTSRGGRNSTVATVTEIYHYLRLVFSRIGIQHCSRCGARVSGLSAADVLQQLVAHHSGRKVFLLAPAVRGRKGFHRDVIARARASGHRVIRIDGELRQLEEVVELSRYREHTIEYVLAEHRVTDVEDRELAADVAAALELGGGTLYALVARRKRPRIYSQELYCSACEIGFDPPDPRSLSFNSSAGACAVCEGSGSCREPTDSEGEDPVERPCSACHGSRLNPDARAVRVGGHTIAELTAMTPGRLAGALGELELSSREQLIAGQALEEIDARSRFLVSVGLDYLCLDRGAHTLSGGEAQRVRLAAQLSARLRGVLYVLDEPTIGLHPADNERLLGALRELVDAGNTAVVVEHDEETILRADYLLELGPGGGSRGGRLVASGPAARVLGGDSPTARALRRPVTERAVYTGRAVERNHERIRVRAAAHHNLQQVDVDVPLERLTVVTGVSGSGKSSLVRDVLGGGLRRVIRGQRPRFGTIGGASELQRVREIDQSPIGKTPTSTPSTYVGLHDEIRRLFARLPLARERGYKPARFSFNVRGGRCEHCKGQGAVRHEMSFLPDVHVPCEVCSGRRFTAETLEVLYRDHSIADVLERTVSEALELFSAVPKLRRALQLLEDVGLGYLRLGQPSNTLSGGEAQRIKLVEELQKSGGRGTVYLMDEPSTGLHPDDLRRLLEVLQRLVDRGDTVVVIEHDLDVICSADWLVDLGPGGGVHGGRVLYQGPREGLAACSESRTAEYLRHHHLRHEGPPG